MEYCPDVVIYHHPCRDGFAAAWACWKRFGDRPEYFGTNYGKPPPDLTGKHCLIVDFSYPRDVLCEIGSVAKSVIVLDHHKTAKDQLTEWIVNDVAGDFWAGDDPLRHVRDHDERLGQPIAAHFDMDRSGAALAWEFCHADAPPKLIQLVEDRDLWRFSFEDTKPFNLMLQTVADDFETWDSLNETMNEERLTEAHGMLRYQSFLVNSIAFRAQEIERDGLKFFAVNCPPELSSEVCHRILEMHADTPFAGSWSDGFWEDDGSSRRGWSLRSEDSRLDVSEIAARYGGGGHRNAAGFVERVA